MTPEDFRAACERCGWTPQFLARSCGYSRNSGSDWASGRVAVPQDVARWLAKIDRHLARNPPPQRREQKKV